MSDYLAEQLRAHAHEIAGECFCDAIERIELLPFHGPDKGIILEMVIAGLIGRRLAASHKTDGVWSHLKTLSFIFSIAWEMKKDFTRQMKARAAADECI